VSNQSPWGGYTIPLIIVILGILGITVDLIFLIAFIVVVGYYLYKIERRVSELEGNPAGQPSAKQAPAK
jgi:uncharacterized membrane protein